MLGPLTSRSRTGVSVRRDNTSAALSCEPTPMPAHGHQVAAQGVADFHAGADRGMRLVHRHRLPDARVARAVGDLAHGSDGRAAPPSRPRRSRPPTAPVPGCGRTQPPATGRSATATPARASACAAGLTMPSTARPWSAAKTTIWGSRKRGFSVFCIKPSRIASGSSSPRLPVVSARRCSFSRARVPAAGWRWARSASGLADMGR